MHADPGAPPDREESHHRAPTTAPPAPPIHASADGLGRRARGTAATAEATRRAALAAVALALAAEATAALARRAALALGRAAAGRRSRAGRLLEGVGHHILRQVQVLTQVPAARARRSSGGERRRTAVQAERATGRGGDPDRPSGCAPPERAKPAASFPVSPPTPRGGKPVRTRRACATAAAADPTTATARNPLQQGRRRALDAGVRQEPVVVLPREAARDKVTRGERGEQLDHLEVGHLLHIRVLRQVEVLLGDDDALCEAAGDAAIRAGERS